MFWWNPRWEGIKYLLQLKISLYNEILVSYFAFTSQNSILSIICLLSSPLFPIKWHGLNTYILTDHSNISSTYVHCNEDEEVFHTKPDNHSAATKLNNKARCLHLLHHVHTQNTSTAHDQQFSSEHPYL